MAIDCIRQVDLLIIRAFGTVATVGGKGQEILLMEYDTSEFVVSNIRVEVSEQ